MKEIGKIEKWIVSILMLFVAVIIGAGILLPYLQVDLSGPISLVAAVSQPVANVFNYLTEFLGNEAGRLTFSALTLLKLTMGKFSGDFPEAAAALKSIKLIILIPYIIVILCFIFAFFRRTWSYIVTAVLSAAGLAVSLLSILLLVPKKLYEAIPKAVRDIADTLKLSEVGFDEAGIRGFVRKGIGISWWIMVIGFALLLILSVIGIVMCVKKRKAVSATHGVCCSFGALNGVGIPLSTGQEILIGKDPSRCNYIASEQGVENVHCRIRYIGNNCYEVTNYSRAGITISGRRIVNSNGVNVQAGTPVIIAIGCSVDLL